jgi:dynein heavy chain
MHTYHFVALGVAPKKAKLAEAQAELEEATGVLNEARAKLAAVVEKLEKLEEALQNAVNEKKSLSDKEQQCKVRLSNADKLIGGLGGERVRWTQTVAVLTQRRK